MTDVATKPSTPSRRRWPIRLRVEKRITEPAWWFPTAVSLGAILVALLLGALVIAIIGGDPWRTYTHIARQSFGSWGVLSDTIVQATPLIMVGLACTIAFRMRLWNIGAEGQFFLGAFGASAVVLIPLVPPDTSPWIMIPAMMLAGITAGALWGFIPGFLKAKLNVNEVITTLMLNYIAVAWNDFFIFAVWSDSGFQMSRVFPRTAWLPRLSDFAAEFPALRGMTTHLGLLFGLVAAVIVWLVLYRSRWGYEIRLIGDNQRSARYAGVNTARNIILVMMFSGALAGLAGMAQISGVVHRLQGAISPGYGFTGIIIAWLAKLNPFMVVVVSVLFGALLLAGRQVQPSGIPRMIQGFVLVSLIASDFLLRYRVRLERVEAEEA